MKLTHLFTATAALTLAGFAHAIAAPILTLFNTGVAANSADGTPASVLGDGIVDPHYTIASDPTGTQSPFVTQGGQAPLLSNWFPNNSTSKWISPRANKSSGADPAGTYTYETTFN